MLWLGTAASAGSGLFCDWSGSGPAAGRNRRNGGLGGRGEVGQVLPVAVASVSAGAASGTGRSAGDVGVWQGRVLLESAQMVAFIGHAV